MKTSYLYFIIFISCILICFYLLTSFSKITVEDDLNANMTEDELYQHQFQDKYAIFSIVRPENIDFSNEIVPISSTEIWERLDKELLKNTYWQSNMLLYIKKANKYFPVIEPILKKNKIPDDFKYLALIESGFENVVSPAGAAGFWQFLNGTAKEYGMEVNSFIDERYNLEKSTQAACDYLNEAYSLFGSWTMAAAAYNMGKNRTIRQIDIQNTNNYYNLHLNSETSRYVFRILAVKEIMEDPEKYGFFYREKDLYPPLSYNTINIDSSIANLYNFADEHQINYKILKQFNPWMLKSSLPNKISKRYQIKIPKIDRSNMIFDNIDHSTLLGRTNE